MTIYKINKKFIDNINLLFRKLNSISANEKGLSLTEVIVAMGIAAVVLGGVVSGLNFVSYGSSQNNMLSTRNELLNKIRIQVSNVRNLLASAKITQSIGSVGLEPDYGVISTLGYPDLLKQCIPDMTDPTSSNCSKSTIEEAGRGYRFYLTDSTSPDINKIIAGEDVYYNQFGKRCVGTESENPSNCPLTARIWFEPFCLNFATTCNKAMSLAIRYSIGLREDYTSNISISNLDGEFYISLQKGVFIRNVLSQNDVVLTPNSKGIYTIPKYYGLAGQTVNGIRLEATVTNPTGLINMRVQMRSVTGIDAKNYLDSQFPATLSSQKWEDIPTPDNPGLGAWSINLSGAISNQIFNFGTQSNTDDNSRPPTSFRIGMDKTGGLNPIYHWTFNDTSTDYLPPSFKSGFYQFRILATDSSGIEIESSNYATVRIAPTPEYAFTNASLKLDRNCANPNSVMTLFVGDDEELTYSEFTLMGSTYKATMIDNNYGKINFPFLLNQPAGSYSFQLTLKDYFSDVALEEMLIPKVQISDVISLADVLATIDPGIINNPEKFKILSTSGKASIYYRTGSCCNANPTVSWNYPSQIEFGNTSLLTNPSGGSTDLTSMTCTMSGNDRTCSTTVNITAKGIVGPSMTSPPPDITAKMDLGASATNNACQNPSTPLTNTISKYIPVINIPNISFYLTESLWLDLPPLEPGYRATALKPTTPRVIVRADFSPSPPATDPSVTEVKVDVVGMTAPHLNEVFCTLSFPTVPEGTVTPPVDLGCTSIPADYTGKLLLQKNPASVTLIKSALDLPSNQIAKLEGKVNHTFCRAKLSSIPEKFPIPVPDTYTLPVGVQSVLDAPWGGDGTLASQSWYKNDNQYWTPNRKKPLRCYDNWRGLDYKYNNQDYYDVYKYNNETVVGTGKPKRSIYLTNDTDESDGLFNWLGFSGTYHFPRVKDPVTGNLAWDPNAVDIPALYVVFQDGDNYGQYNISEYLGTGKGQVVGSNFNYENLTNDICQGDSQLSKIRLLRARFHNETSFSGVYLDFLTSVTSQNMKGAYSYYFVCSYGRWSPDGEPSVTWKD